MKKVYSNPLFFVASAGVFVFGLWHFTRLAVLPRLPGQAAAQ